MIPDNPPPTGGMGIVIPFPSAAAESPLSANRSAERCRLGSFIAVAERVADLLAVFAAVLVAWRVQVLMGLSSGPAFSDAAVLRSAALFSLLFVLLLEKRGEYRPYRSLLAVRETERLLRVLVESLSVAILVTYFAAPQLLRTLPALVFVAVPVGLGIEKAALLSGVRQLRRLGYGNRRAVILGAGPLAKNVYSVLSRSPKLGLEPVALVDEQAAMDGVEIHANAYRCGQPALVLAGPLSAKLFGNLRASVLIIADPELDAAETLEIMSRAASVGVTPYLVSRDYLEPGCWIEYSELDGLMLGRMSSDRRRRSYEICKRIFDVVGAALLLLLVSPAMLAVAVLVKRNSPGPALFKQQRIGHNGRKFWLYKFRSMHLYSAIYECSPKTGDDKRITSVGRFLRRTCLDELPQLWNVLRGDMSLVGPRPEMPFIVGRYSAVHRQRLCVKPGLTGLWQLSGDRNCAIHENLEYDIYYIRNRNLFMDVAILLHSFIFAARGV